MPVRHVFGAYDGKGNIQLGEFQYCPCCGKPLELLEKGGKQRRVCPDCGDEYIIENYQAMKLGEGLPASELSLDRPATYQVKVPGHLDESWSEWDGKLTVSVGSDPDGSPVTTLTGSLDQAALQGLLRRIYSLGLPLISVNLLARE